VELGSGTCCFMVVPEKDPADTQHDKTTQTESEQKDDDVEDRRTNSPFQENSRMIQTPPPRMEGGGHLSV